VKKGFLIFARQNENLERKAVRRKNGFKGGVEKI